MRILLIDTCSEVGSVALADGESITAAEELQARAASSSLLASVNTMLVEAGWGLESIEAVGVVSGPGSFTGVRGGLAAAKGLCEARGLPLAAVSRLEVLAEVAELHHGYAVINAGRGELYVRHIDRSGRANESLLKVEDLLRAVQLQKEEQVNFRASREEVVIAEEGLLLPLSQINPEMHPLIAAAALPAILRRLQVGGDAPESLDANYVRSEHEIYGRSKAAIASSETEA